MQPKKPKTASAGFTYSLSMLFLILVLISIAAYMGEWRRNQQSVVTNILQTDLTRSVDRISADVSEVLGADATISYNTSRNASAKLWVRFPFRKEGLGGFATQEYAQALPFLLRGTNLEAVLDTRNLQGANATVLYFFGRALNFSNEGTTDTAIYSHPSYPKKIRLDIFCEKSALRILPLQTSGSSTGNQTTYEIYYRDLGGAAYSSTSTEYVPNNASFGVFYADGTALQFVSNVSSSLSGITSISYTKSPGASLILPFDSNATIGSGVQDYSPNSYNLSLGGGNPANAPTWQQESCPSGGCYSFDGINDFINGSPISIDSPPSFQLGEERVLDGGLETVITGNPDDGYTDSWTYWTARNLNSYLFDSTTTSVSGKAVKIYGGTNISSYFNQSIRIVGNTLYNLTLYSRGQGARYAIVSTSNSYYLQNDGSWSATINLFSTGASPGAYSATTKLFALPYGLTNISIRLYPSSVSGETVYYDSISLRQAAGMNGGFEYYFADNIG